jgi:aryl-alcohol dehydrogenase
MLKRLNGREIHAAVVREKAGPFRLGVVRIVATGMCHTDMVPRDEFYNVPHPIVLGHEGA